MSPGWKGKKGGWGGDPNVKVQDLWKREVPWLEEQGASAGEVGGESHVEECLLVEMEALMWRSK